MVKVSRDLNVPSAVGIGRVQQTGSFNGTECLLYYYHVSAIHPPHTCDPAIKLDCICCIFSPYQYCCFPYLALIIMTSMMLLSHVFAADVAVVVVLSAVNNFVMIIMLALTLVLKSTIGRQWLWIFHHGSGP
jgi:hypothetical protein